MELLCDTLYNSAVRALIQALTGLNAWIGVIIIVVSRCTDTFSGAAISAVAFCGLLLACLVAKCNCASEEAVLLAEENSNSHAWEVARLLAAVRLRGAVARKHRATDQVATMYLAAHIARCPLRSCRVRVMQAKGRMNLKTNRAEVIAALTSVISGNFKEALIRHKESAVIRLLYVGFLLAHAKNYILAWEVNEGVKACKASLIERVNHFVYRYPAVHTICRKRIKDLINNRTQRLGRSMEPLEIELREHGSEKMCKLIVETSTAYGQFWDTLQDRVPAYERFVALGFAILRGNRRIKRIWRTLASSKGKMPIRLLGVYMAYADQVLRDPQRAAEIHEYFDRPELLMQNNVILQYVGSGNGVLGVSADRRQLGLIRHANAAMCELSGYMREELMATRLESLMPRIFAETHEDHFARLCAMAELGEEAPMVTKQTFLVHKSHYVVPVVVQVVAGPNYTNNYSFVARVRRDMVAGRFEAVHILTDERNVVVAVTSSNSGFVHNVQFVDAALLLNIDNDTIKSTTINVNLLLPNIDHMSERTPTDTLMRIPARFPATEGNHNQLLFRTNSLGLIRSQSHDTLSYEEATVNCQWNAFRRPDGTILGYHYDIVRAPAEHSIAGWKRQILALTTSPQMLEFAYDLRSNAFYQSQDCAHAQDIDALLFPSCADPLPDEALANPSPRPRQAKQLPGFIAPIYPQVRRMCEQTGDYTLLEKVRFVQASWGSFQDSATTERGWSCGASWRAAASGRWASRHTRCLRSLTSSLRSLQVPRERTAKKRARR